MKYLNRDFYDIILSKSISCFMPPNEPTLIRDTRYKTINNLFTLENLLFELKL